ncbi:HD-GYP domain-containing protein [Anaerotignum sp. MB30-C6]|uniref:HD-GYP domain-containing protein n=1 Tax=Anaerotignum sp. MB30-C6 TaxID=3070814 RepID=UPI0027DD4AD7|nr:HD-GYP domain-containing protein [Anaerotignum sp. MB30-C6]WMI82007.1 HD-GYP domain-containing protein [Anaerotignum sp. MB30-C6]
MRYLPIHQISEDSILAIPVYNDSGSILLNANTVLKRAYLSKLSLLGYAGLYIYDDISEGIFVKELLSEQLKRSTVRALKSFNLDACRLMAHSIVDELINQSDVAVDMVNIAAFDNYTYAHCINVSVLSVIVGMGMGLNYDQLKQLSEAALLHDIGKLSISLGILNKKEKLTDEEMAIIRSHPEEGYKAIKDNFMISGIVKNAVLSHHENEDGSGYPRKLKGNQIHLYAKIIHVCDVYDALVSNRVYRKAMNPADALEYLMSNSWIMFDVYCVKKIMEYVSPYPTGITVELSNGQRALVVEQNRIHHLRPKVVITDTEEEVDLMKVLNLTIVKILT